MKTAAIVLTIVSLCVSSGLSLFCEQCSGTTCLQKNLVLSECTRNIPQLPYGDLKVTNPEDAEYKCIDIEYLRTKAQPISIKQCYIATPDQDVCSELIKQLPLGVAIQHCQIRQPIDIASRNINLRQETTEAPVDTTEAPVDTTEAPVDTTEAPVDTTEAPVDTTEAPVDTTEAPVDTTEAPVDTTEAPVDTTEAPVDTTEAPVDTTEAPVDTTAAPVDTTLAPGETTAAPGETTAAPGETTAAPGSTTESPETTTAGAATTTLSLTALCSIVLSLASL